MGAGSDVPAVLVSTAEVVGSLLLVVSGPDGGREVGGRVVGSWRVGGRMGSRVEAAGVAAGVAVGAGLGSEE